MKSWAATRDGLRPPPASPASPGQRRLTSFSSLKYRSTRRLFSKRVKQCVADNEYCVIAVSEGARYADGRFLADAGTTDAFGHKQLGGVAQVVAQLVKDELGLKYHYAIADYLQRSARHIASATDVKQAYAVGKAAVELALAGENSVMATIVRKSDRPYRLEYWQRCPGSRGQSRKDAAEELYHQGRFRHHGRRASLPRTPHTRRRLSALQARAAGLRQPEERPGGPETG